MRLRMETHILWEYLLLYTYVIVRGLYLFIFLCQNGLLILLDAPYDV